MNEKITEIVFIIDRSGSMSGFEADTVGGFNSTLKQQREDTHEGSAAYVTTVLFSNGSETVHDRLPIEKVGEMKLSDYRVGGCTALTDIIIPAGADKIGWHAFAGCTNLRTVTIPKSVSAISGDAFEGCSHLTIEAPRFSHAWLFCKTHGIPCHIISG